MRIWLDLTGLVFTVVHAVNANAVMRIIPLTAKARLFFIITTIVHVGPTPKVIFISSHHELALACCLLLYTNVVALF